MDFDERQLKRNDNVRRNRRSVGGDYINRYPLRDAPKTVIFCLSCGFTGKLKKKLSSTTCCKVCTSIVPKESSFVCRQLKGWKSEEGKSDFSEERKVLLCWWKIRSPLVTMESNPFCKRSFVLVSHTAACASCAGVGARVSCVKDFSAFFLGKLSSVGYECSNNSDRRRTFIVSIFSTKKTP